MRTSAPVSFHYFICISFHSGIFSSSKCSIASPFNSCASAFLWLIDLLSYVITIVILMHISQHYLRCRTSVRRPSEGEGAYHAICESAPRAVCIRCQLLAPHISRKIYLALLWHANEKRASEESTSNYIYNNILWRHIVCTFLPTKFRGFVDRNGKKSALFCAGNCEFVLHADFVGLYAIMLGRCYQ